MLWKQSFRTTVLHLFGDVVSGRDPIWRDGGFDEREAERGAAAGDLDELDLAAVALGHLAHDGQAQARALPAAGGLRAVEAVEDVGAVAGIDAWTVVADEHVAALARDLHDAARVAPLGSVLHEVPERAVELLGIADHGGRPALVLELELREAVGSALEHVLHHAVELHLPQMQVALAAARQVHEIAHQRAQLLRLPSEVAQQALAILGAELRVVAQDLDVGAQTGERGAQLVGGVVHELALRAHRGVERVEHRVEGPRELAQLVLAIHRDPLAEVARLGHGLRGVAHPPDRAQCAPRHEQADHGGEQDADRVGDAQAPGQAAQRAVHLLERLGHDYGVPLALRPRGQPHVRAVHRGVGEVGAPTRPGDVERLLGHGQLEAALGLRRQRQLAASVDHLDVRAQAAEVWLPEHLHLHLPEPLLLGRPYRPAALEGPGEQLALRRWRRHGRRRNRHVDEHHVRLLADRLVDAGAQLVALDHVGGHGADHQYQRDRRRAVDRHAVAEAHLTAP